MSITRPAQKALAALALQAMLLAGCAHAGGRVAEIGPPGPPPPPPPVADQVLLALPEDAPPGDCYARVMIPGQPMVGPPQAQGATWVLNPGPPGSPGPIWCLVPTGPAPVVFTPEREGFIRVLCDTDATPARIGRWQKKLHEEGYYRGDVTGRYDGPTAEAVGRYQRDRHIEHGGYLSRQTVESLEGPDAPPPGVRHAKPAHPPAIGKPSKLDKRERQAAAAAGGVGYAPYPALGAAAAYGYPAYPSYPAYPQTYPAAPQAYAYPQAGHVQGYAAGSSSSSSYSASSYGAAGYGYGAVAPPQPSGYAYGYAAPVQGYGQAYGQQAYGQSYSYGQQAAYGSYGYSSESYYAAYGPRPAYAAPRSAIQGGWLTWDGKPRF